jgi:hypothetical protein
MGCICIDLYEKIGLGTLVRKIHGSILNLIYPDYNLFNALALKSGPPGTPVFIYESDGKEVKIMPMGKHLDAHGESIDSVEKLKEDFFKITKGQKQGKVDWMFENKILGKKYLSEFVQPEGPARLHYLPKAKCLAIGGGRNRIVTLMKFGYWNAKQLKEAVWDEASKKYLNGDVIINTPGKPVWDDVPGRTDIQDWVDKTKRWDDAYAAGLRFKVRDIYNILFK